MTKVTLRAHRLSFFSQTDETAFFHWLGLLKDVAVGRGDGDTIFIDVHSNKIDDEQLRELIALFHRYRIDMRQLLVFENRSNKGWLRAKEAYWYEAVYESAHAA